MSEAQENLATNEAEVAAVSTPAPVAPAGTLFVTKKFNFKQRSLRDEAGKEIEKLPKQPSVQAPIPVPTAAAVIAILSQPDTLTVAEEGKEPKEAPNQLKQMVLDAINTIVFDQAKSHLDAAIDGFGSDKTKQVNASFIDYDKLSLEYIVSIPPARRGAVPITDEEWNDMFVDYQNVMIQVTQKPKETLAKHVDIFKNLRKYRTRKDVLGVMQDQLNIYGASTASMEDFSAQYERLTDTLEKFLKEDDKIDINAL